MILKYLGYRNANERCSQSFVVYGHITCILFAKPWPHSDISPVADPGVSTENSVNESLFTYSNRTVTIFRSVYRYTLIEQSL